MKINKKDKTLKNLLLIKGESGFNSHLFQSIKKAEGFSILEITVSLIIIILLLGVTLVVYISYNKLFAAETNTADVQINNVLMMNSITNEVKISKKILDEKSINGNLFQTNTTTLVLSYPVFDVNNNLISGATDFGAFFLDPLDSTKLIFTLETDANSSRSNYEKTIGNLVDNLIFRFDNASTTEATNVTVLLTTKTASSRDEGAVTQTNSISLRNK